MAKGGARNRSGPAADPNSERSEKRGFVLTALPNQGYDGDVPGFPLPPRFPEGESETAEMLAEQIHERELELWAWSWTTPQACAWSLESWRWPTVAMWVRTFVICEGSEATAADKASLHRFADQIGLTPAGLKENGWAIAPNQVGAKAAEKAEPEAAPKRERRLRSVDAQ